MVRIKEMPYHEKYAQMLDNMKFDDAFITPFIKKHLGDQAAADLQRIWQQGAKAIPEDASFEEKYEVAYSNWIWIARNAYSFIRERLGEDGIEQFDRAEVEALKRKNASPALFLLKLIRALLPGSAFMMSAKQMAYKLQWLTPFSTSELTKHRTVFDIPRCKILDYSDTDDICMVGCQKTYPMWVAEQFKVEMKFERSGNSCTCTLAPLG